LKQQERVSFWSDITLHEKKQQSSFEYVNVLLWLCVSYLFYKACLVMLNVWDSRSSSSQYIIFCPNKCNQQVLLFSTEKPAINIHQNYWFYFLVLRDFFSCNLRSNADYHNISNNTITPQSMEQSPS